MSQTKPRSSSTPHRQSQGGKDFRKRVQRSKQQGQTPARQTASSPRTGNPAARPGIILKAEREKSLLRRHPWIFSGAIEYIDGKPASGDTVPVRDAAGNFLAWAAYNADSQIAARVWSWREQEVIDQTFFRNRIANALAARRTLGLDRDSNGMRLIHGESDGLPGLIVDRYGDVLVMQLGSAGPEHWRDTLADILQELCAPVCIYERSDSDGRELEGLPKRNGAVRGTLPENVEVVEHGIRFTVDVAEGQKTGYYLDQRDNRALTGTLAQDKDVLNCFCYTGGFSLYALRGGAKLVLSIDSSQEALQLAQRNVELNGLDASRTEWQCADVFDALRKLRDQNRKFDLIVLDPPKFAPTAAFAEKASRAYKDINLLGFKLLRPGGLLFTYSCSGGISDDLFQKIIAGAALDAGVDAQIVRKLHAAADHPVLLSFPEGAYLKGLVLRVA
ncbi:ribosomal RNA large subunit methyltransferase I [Sideroxyarcus emersonii]|uniref:Ribosomal RNA large subunit methyltransferase I n=1 Tax=Sideroxyarcus emersonii TaxID=2764705 RepID=A0AAN1X7B0_9PROT|nr:class I SAM-dependent rRNA methyltransferase [Sideroxyarcus emersonii]BCK86366.1 ribosomal RNA large subunit methyltransferase I [Sideroxyarcus emersonii]